MSVQTPHGVKCGNRAKHGSEVVYHQTVAAVKACFGAPQNRVQSEAPQEALVPVPAPAPAPVNPGPTPAEVEAQRQAEARARYARWSTIPVERDDYAHYALPSTTGGSPNLYRVRRPSRGQYAGRTYVDLELGNGSTHKMPFHQSALVLDRIAADPVAAAVLYGQSTSRCSVCHRKLKATESVERGIGPVCLSRIGG